MKTGDATVRVDGKRADYFIDLFIEKRTEPISPPFQVVFSVKLLLFLKRFLQER